MTVLALRLLPLRCPSDLLQFQIPVIQPAQYLALLHGIAGTDHAFSYVSIVRGDSGALHRAFNDRFGSHPILTGDQAKENDGRGKHQRDQLGAGMARAEQYPRAAAERLAQTLPLAAFVLQLEPEYGPEHQACRFAEFDLGGRERNSVSPLQRQHADHMTALDQWSGADSGVLHFRCQLVVRNDPQFVVILRGVDNGNIQVEHLFHRIADAAHQIGLAIEFRRVRYRPDFDGARLLESDTGPVALQPRGKLVHNRKRRGTEATLLNGCSHQIRHQGYPR